MTCVVFGGSGQIGRYLLPRLRERQVSTVAFSRNPRDDVGGVVWRQAQLPDAVPCLSAGVTSIVSLGPLDLFSHWLEQATLSGSPRVVAMSSMSALSKRDSPVADERELAARLRDSEQRLLARCQNIGCACTILRATIIYGGAGGSLERLAAKAERWHVFPLPRGHGLRQPVHADDLARAVIAAMERPQGAGIVHMGGGERVTASVMYARTRRQLAPHALGVLAPNMACRLLAAVSGRGRGMVGRLNQDLIADNARLTQVLGVEPRSFQPQRVDDEA